MSFETFDRTKAIKLYNEMLKEMDNSDICWTYGRIKKRCCLLNKREMEIQMKSWRKLARDGKIKIEKFNDRSKTINDKEYHFFVVQTTNDNDTMFDPIGCSLYGFIVSGYIYSFKNKSNRDKVREYVMKGIN